MAQINVQIDDSNVNAKLAALKDVKDGAPRATMRAMNRTVTGMKTDAAKEISLRYTVKQEDIKGSDKKGIRSLLDAEKATMSDLSITLRSRGRPFRSIKFQHTANKRPGRRGSAAAFLRVKKGESGGLLSGKPPYSKAFIATMPNGVEGIFQRTGKSVDPLEVRTGKSKSRHLRRSNREDIKQVSSPGAVQMLSNPEIKEAIPKKATDRFYKELDHEIKNLLRRQ